MSSLDIQAVPVGLSFGYQSYTPTSIGLIIDPSKNLNGIVVKTMYLSIATTTGASSAGIIADTTAPTVYNDVTRRIVLSVAAPASYASASAAPYPLYLYPGQGLWVTGGAGASGGAYITYDVLTPQGH